MLYPRLRDILEKCVNHKYINPISQTSKFTVGITQIITKACQLCLSNNMFSSMKMKLSAQF